MNIQIVNLPIEYPAGETALVSLKWMRGANRYNNGATRYQNKHRIRLIMGWASAAKTEIKRPPEKLP
jgi:hypothetical protein